MAVAAPVIVPALPSPPPLDATSFLDKITKLETDNKDTKDALDKKTAELDKIKNATKNKKGLYEKAPSLMAQDNKLVVKELLGNFTSEAIVNEFINKNSLLLYKYRRACDFFSAQLAHIAPFGKDMIDTYITQLYIYVKDSTDVIDTISTKPTNADSIDLLNKCYRKQVNFANRKLKIVSLSTPSTSFDLIDDYKDIFNTLVHVCINPVWIKSEHMNAIQSYIKKECRLFGNSDDIIMRKAITAAIIYVDIFCKINNYTNDPETAKVTVKKGHYEKLHKAKGKAKGTAKGPDDKSINFIIDVIQDSIKTQIEPLKPSEDKYKKASEVNKADIKKIISLSDLEIELMYTILATDQFDRSIDNKFKFDGAKYYTSRADGNCGFSAITQIYENNNDDGRTMETTNRIYQLRVLLGEAYDKIAKDNNLITSMNLLLSPDDNIKNGGFTGTFAEYSKHIVKDGIFATDDDFIILLKLLGDITFVLLANVDNKVVNVYNNSQGDDSIPYYVFFNVQLNHWQLKHHTYKRDWAIDYARAQAIIKSI